MWGQGRGAEQSLFKQEQLDKQLLISNYGSQSAAERYLPFPQRQPRILYAVTVCAKSQKK